MMYTKTKIKQNNIQQYPDNIILSHQGKNREKNVKKYEIT